MSQKIEVQTVAPRADSTKFGKFGKVGLMGSAALAAATSSNAALEVTELVTEIEGNGTAMTTVMLSVLTLVALFVGYRMIKRSMS